MASTWIVRRQRSDGGTTYRVSFRLGGRESTPKHGGSFRTMREARIRRDWIAGELAAMRMPNLEFGSPSPAQRLGAAAAAWRSSRVDVAEGTAATHRVNLGRSLPALGERDVDSIEPADVAAFVSQLHAGGLKRESIRKSVSTLAMVLDIAGRTGEHNPARDRLTVKLPREAREEPKPPTAEQVLAIYRLLAPAYRLPLLVLDATGMRVGELEALTWGDVDEARSRWRVSQAVAKTGQARWVAVPEPLFGAVLELVPRDDRTPERRVFQGDTADRLRTAIARACTAAGVPAFSPHDLRHRRISLLHLSGALLGITAAALIAALPVGAKEGAKATLTTSTPLDAPAGTQLKVSWRLFSVDETGQREPFGANGVFVRLRSASSAHAEEGFAPVGAYPTGEYEATVVAPAGGIADVEIGLMGWRSDATGTRRADVLFPITNDPVPGGARVASPGSSQPVLVGPESGSMTWVLVLVAGVLSTLAALASAVVLRKKRRRDAMPITDRGASAGDVVERVV